MFSLGNHRRVDLDNLGKAILDALNGVAWVDDSQVVLLQLFKRVTNTPGAHIEVRSYPIHEVD